MAEAEDVITDAARHLTEFAQTLWRKHRPHELRENIGLGTHRRHIELLITAVFGDCRQIRPAQPPATPSLLQRVFRRGAAPSQQAVPATDGISIWLPADSGTTDAALALECYRVAALAQAARIARGSARHLADATRADAEDIYLLLECFAADRDLTELLPGMISQIAGVRRRALALRPSPRSLTGMAGALETMIQAMLRAEPGASTSACPLCDTPAESLAQALWLDAELRQTHGVRPAQTVLLAKDWWTGRLMLPEAVARALPARESPEAGDAPDRGQARTAQLTRRPRVREATEEADESPGAFMIQTSQPHEHAEDPFGMQRPTDRDQETALDDFAESLADLPEAQLVRSPQRAKDIFLSDDAPAAQPLNLDDVAARSEGAALIYPEWDYRLGHYRAGGAHVHCALALPGPADWVSRTLQTYAGALGAIRRRFEMLRAEPIRLRRQRDGDEIDLEACLARYADLRSGRSADHGLYQTRRVQDRDIAVSLLIDASASTDSWVSGNRRVIDVAREALLLVCLALERTDVRYAVQAFSGESRQGVVVREVKGFDEPQSQTVGLRIAGLEPEHSTRVGAAVRHATAGLMRQGAAHRLLLLLSDGRPNDIDEYEGRYGLEDARQSVIEARLQGVSVFCLTIDRQYSAYLPRIFGRDYAVLREAERLPAVLLDWMKMLMSR